MRPGRSAETHVLAPLLGALLVAVLTVLDIAWGPERVLAATVVIGPFLTALSGSLRQTAAVAAAAVAVVVLSGGWNENFGSVDYLLRVLVVLVGALFAVEGARARLRLGLDRRRFRLLSDAAAIGDRRQSVTEAVDRVRELVVPDLADVCEIDLDPAAARPAETDPEGRAMIVPLRARGMEIGALRLTLTSPSRGTYGADDVAFAKVLAGRVALALDNAGLFSEVESLEARQTAALGSLDEAVTIQDADGSLLYANEAAAKALGFASPEELLATPPREIIDAWEGRHEDGRPLRTEDLPGRRVLAGETPEPLLLRARHRQTGEERWRLVKATAVRDPEGRPRMAVNVIEDVTDVKRAEMAQRFLAEAGVLLGSSLDQDETLQRVAALVVPQLADWCSVSLPDDRGYLRAVAVAHSDPDKVRIAREYNRRFPVHVGSAEGSALVLRDGASQLHNEITDDLLDLMVEDPERRATLQSLGMRAAMIVPLVGTHGVIGTLTFVSAESGRRFSEADLELAEELGRRAGTAVENARLYTERSHIARTLQTGLLPDALPTIPGFEIASLYRPAGEENLVGGDFYDGFHTPAAWMLTVGDVTGRGAEAAALTAQARHTLRTAGILLGEPVAAIEELNRALVGRRDLPFCTVAVVLVEEDGDRTRARIACAGHPQPLLVRRGEVRRVGAIGPVVGAWEDASWDTEVVGLDPDDVLVLYTDGVTDAHGRDGRFGEARLTEALRGATGAQDAVARVQAALTAFERGAQADDTAMVALQRRPVAVPVA